MASRPWPLHMGLTRWIFILLVLSLAGAPRVGGQITVTGQVRLTNRTNGERLKDHSQVVIWLNPLSDIGATLPEDQQALRLVQRHKTFEPHLLVVRAGSVVQFPNDDPFFHNVFSLFEGKRFDLGLYEAGSTRSVLFDKPGVCYLFCNIHPEMSAVIVVVATPYFAVSNRMGEISIPNVLAGPYELHVWNERSLPKELDALDRRLSVSESAHTLETIFLSAGPNEIPTHKNKYGRNYDSATPHDSLYSQP